MISRLVRAGIAAVLLSASSSHAFAQTPTVRLVLDFAIQGQQSPFVLAADGGYFARAGVNVRIDRGYGSADAVAKVVSGAYDMAFADIGALIQVNGKQVGPHIVSVFRSTTWHQCSFFP
jgi:NitT/TauT family transport system substrate-binding protein